jgi:hypothetical protein
MTISNFDIQLLVGLIDSLPLADHILKAIDFFEFTVYFHYFSSFIISSYIRFDFYTFLILLLIFYKTGINSFLNNLIYAFQT